MTAERFTVQHLNYGATEFRTIGGCANIPNYEDACSIAATAARLSAVRIARVIEADGTVVFQKAKPKESK